MELWIRSQNKQELTKAEHVGVYGSKVYIDGYDEHGYCIAGYKSKERALEVLDEVQSILEQILDPNITISPIFVYEMPED